MRNTAKTVATVSLLALSQAYCFIESSYLEGPKEGEPFSNKEHLESLDLDMYKFEIIKTCMNEIDELIGIRFSMLNQYDESSIEKQISSGSIHLSPNVGRVEREENC